MENSSILQLTCLMFFVMNPIGTVPIFIVTLKNFSQKAQRAIILRETLLACFLMILFALGGNSFFSFFDISVPAFQISGGCLLSIMSSRMLYAPIPSLETSQNSILKDSVLFPFAFPLLTGPGVMTTSIAFSQTVGLQKTLIALVFTGVGAFVVLLSTGIFKKILKPNHMLALERFFGVLIFSIGVTVFLGGVLQVFGK